MERFSHSCHRNPRGPRQHQVLDGGARTRRQAKVRHRSGVPACIEPMGTPRSVWIHPRYASMVFGRQLLSVRSSGDPFIDLVHEDSSCGTRVGARPRGSPSGVRETRPLAGVGQRPTGCSNSRRRREQRSTAKRFCSTGSSPGKRTPRTTSRCSWASSPRAACRGSTPRTTSRGQSSGAAPGATGVGSSPRRHSGRVQAGGDCGEGVGRRTRQQAIGAARQGWGVGLVQSRPDRGDLGEAHSTSVRERQHRSARDRDAEKTELQP
jgi:hypothetical protein